MARRSKHSYEEIKMLVLNAAEAIVVEEGGAALNLRAVATKIGYTVGAVYMVFANRADLIWHINARTLDAIQNAYTEAQSCNDEVSIETLTNIYLMYASQNFNRWRMILDDPLRANEKIPTWYQNRLDKLFMPIEAHFAKLVPQSPEAYRKRAAWVLGCSVHGICVLSLRDSPDKACIKRIEDMITLIVRQFMQGWPPQFTQSESPF